MEETAVANGGAAADVAAPEKKDMATKEVAAESKDAAVADKNAEEQNKGLENGTEGPSDGDVQMEEVESAKEGDGDAGVAKQADSKDIKIDADAKEHNSAKAAEGEAVKMTEAEVGNTKVKDKQDELKEQEKGGLADQEENKGKETVAAEKQEEAEEKGSAEKKEEDAADKVEENKETPKNKKARSARDRSQGKDKKQDGSKSREAKSLLNTPSPYGTDRPQRERKTVERLVEVIEKEPNRNFVVEKGRGTPLKDIPSVAHRISRKKPADLKFLHNVLFGRKGKTLDFKGHILQFSGFVWHESDEKLRAKAKEKLDKCVKDMLLDLCWLLAIPVPKPNIRKEDIVSKLLDFIAEPHGDSGLSDDQGSNSRKRKRGGGSASKAPESTPNRSRKKFGDDTTSGKNRKKALMYDTDEDEDEDESIKSDSEENKAEDVDDEQENDYDSGKEKASRKSSEVKESSGKKKIDTGSGHKTSPPRTISKSPVKKSSSKISKEKESPDDSAKVFSRKRKPTPKSALISEKETKEKRSSGKKVTKSKWESVEADLPSKDELRKTITGILKKVDFNTATFSDILKKLDNHYKMDLTPKKEAIKIMIQDELTKLSEEANEDEDKKEDAEKKQKQHQAKEVEA